MLNIETRSERGGNQRDRSQRSVSNIQATSKAVSPKKQETHSLTHSHTTTHNPNTSFKPQSEPNHPLSIDHLFHFGASVSASNHFALFFGIANVKHVTCEGALVDKQSSVGHHVARSISPRSDIVCLTKSHLFFLCPVPHPPGAIITIPRITPATTNGD